MACQRVCRHRRLNLVLTPHSEAMAEPMSGEIPSEFRPFAALLTSKTYFYIGVLNEAVEFALKAGKAFENEPAGEYKETIIGESAGETRGVSVGFLPQLVR